MTRQDSHSDDNLQDIMIPVSILTGFLGSGKTTLLNQLLQQSDMANTAVVVNEFGEIGIDHLLVEESNDDVVIMNSGCLCCTIRGDLVDTLRSLYVRSTKGEIPEFNRLVVETTGLADPAPILHTIMSDPFLVTRYRLDGVITTVDGVNGRDTLDNQFESVKQAAVADRLILTKSDLADEETQSQLKTRLTELNPSAPIFRVANGQVAAAVLFDAGLYNPENKSLDVQRWLREEAYTSETGDHDHAHHHDVNRHDDRVNAFCFYLDEPLSWDQITTWLDMLTIYRGSDLLRIKGILNVTESDKPVVVHGVQHVFHPPVLLEQGWPTDDHRSRLVFITKDMDETVVSDMLKSLQQDQKTIRIHR